LRYSSPRWRIWEVRGTDPPASDGATVLATGPNWFEVDATRPTIVRQRYTPYWQTSDACLRRAPGGWTEIDPARGASVLVVRARFELGRGHPQGCGQPH
jgi:hypothetical protein